MLICVISCICDLTANAAKSLCDRVSSHKCKPKHNRHSGRELRSTHLLLMSETEKFQRRFWAEIVIKSLALFGCAKGSLWRFSVGNAKISFTTHLNPSKTEISSETTCTRYRWIAFCRRLAGNPLPCGSEKSLLSQYYGDVIDTDQKHEKCGLFVGLRVS